MKRDLFICLKYWETRAKIEERYTREFTGRRCRIFLSQFENNLRDYNKRELKELSSEISKTRAELKLILEELNKNYKDRLRKENGPFRCLMVSTFNTLLSLVHKILDIFKE